MSRLKALFQQKKERVLNVYCTAGYPELQSTLPVMRALQDSGADIIELGMPYSDPLADGPVIQQSSARAILNGMTIEQLFAQLKDFRKEIHIPVVLMGYLNPVLQYGFEKCCREAAAIGIDGLILPDLPEYEFETYYGPIIRTAGLDFIFLVTPETDPGRVQRLDKLSSGFLYAVSSSSITGKDTRMDSVPAYLKRLQTYDLQNPVLVGFGIKDKRSFTVACEYANGAIIGSAFINALDQGADIREATRSFLSNILS